MHHLRSLIPALLFCYSFGLYGENRTGRPGWRFEVTGGIGGVSSVEGLINETLEGANFSGAVALNINEIGLEDDSSSFTAGAKAYNRWVTLLVDYRQSSLSASGVAEDPIRLEVDELLLGGNSYEFLLIPEGVAYSVNLDSSWLGLGGRWTPWSFGGDGTVRFTPWLHLGLQAVSMDYDVDAGGTVGIEGGGQNRQIARQGRAKGSGEAVIPEYGLGAELRVPFHEPGERGIELVCEATYKILDFQGALDSLGIDSSRFEDLDFEYASLEAGAFLQFPVGDSLDLLAGLTVEQVDIDAQLSDRSRQEGNLQRTIEESHTLYAFKIGLLF